MCILASYRYIMLESNLVTNLITRGLSYPHHGPNHRGLTYHKYGAKLIPIDVSTLSIPRGIFYHQEGAKQSLIKPRRIIWLVNLCRGLSTLSQVSSRSFRRAMSSAMSSALRTESRCRRT